MQVRSSNPVHFGKWTPEQQARLRDSRSFKNAEPLDVMHVNFFHSLAGTSLDELTKEVLHPPSGLFERVKERLMHTPRIQRETRQLLEALDIPGMEQGRQEDLELLLVAKLFHAKPEDFREALDMIGEAEHYTPSDMFMSNLIKIPVTRRRVHNEAAEAVLSSVAAVSRVSLPSNVSPLGRRYLRGE